MPVKRFIRRIVVVLAVAGAVSGAMAPSASADKLCVDAGVGPVLNKFTVQDRKSVV